MATSIRACVILLAAWETWGIADLYRCPPSNAFYRRAAYRIPIPGSFLPVLCSKPPGNTKARVAIIPIHGARREQEAYYKSMLDNAVSKHEVVKGTTVVIVPAFQRKTCFANQWPPNHAAKRIPAPTWHDDGDTQPYYTGNDGTKKDKVRISSFKALDHIVEWTVEKYPKLRLVVVTGFSAGSQMALNWAIMSPAGTDGIVHLKGSSVHLRIIVQSPGTVTYLDNNRPAPNCVPLKDTGPYHSCPTFKPPKQKCGTQHYDKYKFGTDGFENGGPATTQYPSLTKYLKATLTPGGDWDTHYRKAIRDRFASKDIRYQVGNQDTKNCKVGKCVGTCGAMAMGTSRLQRLQNFAAYVEQLHPQPQPNSIPFAIFEGSHRDYLGFGSPFFALWAFQQPFSHAPPKNLPDTWTVHDRRNCFPGSGAGHIFKDDFSLIVPNEKACKRACRAQHQPLCQGVVTSRNPHDMRCFLLSNVQPRKCRRDGRYRLHHLTRSYKKGEREPEDLMLEREGVEEDLEIFSVGALGDGDEAEPASEWPSAPAAALVLAALGASALAVPRLLRKTSPGAGARVVEMHDAEAPNGCSPAVRHAAEEYSPSGHPLLAAE